VKVAWNDFGPSAMLVKTVLSKDSVELSVLYRTQPYQSASFDLELLLRVVNHT
jgi:hypothetical protein